MLRPYPSKMDYHHSPSPDARMVSVREELVA